MLYLYLQLVVVPNGEVKAIGKHFVLIAYFIDRLGLKVFFGIA